MQRYSQHFTCIFLVPYFIHYCVTGSVVCYAANVHTSELHTDDIGNM